LPFTADQEGPKKIVPVACEGDLNGLMGLAILHFLNPDVPPLFGDFVEYTNDYILLRNCGASSLYWAARSGNPRENLSAADLLPNMHGKSGAALHYETAPGGDVTICRLFRRNGSFGLIFGRGMILMSNDDSAYSDPWPHTRISLEVDHQLLLESFPCNHASLTEGDYTGELEWLCRFWGIAAFRIESESDLRSLL
jgi:L-fucose isomerase-like protein